MVKYCKGTHHYIFFLSFELRTIQRFRCEVKNKNLRRMRWLFRVEFMFSKGYKSKESHCIFLYIFFLLVSFNNRLVKVSCQLLLFQRYTYTLYTYTAIRKKKAPVRDTGLLCKCERTM